MAYCKKHKIEYQEYRMIQNIKFDIKCPECIKEDEKKREEELNKKKYERYIKYVNWRLSVSNLPKVYIEQKINKDLIPNAIKTLFLETNIFLYGKSGVGKTMSIKYIICKHFTKNIYYIDSVLVKNYSQSKLTKLYEQCEKVFALCIDEVQVLPIQIFEILVEIVYNDNGFFILCGNFENNEVKTFIESLDNRVKSRLMNKRMTFIEFKNNDLRLMK